MDFSKLLENKPLLYGIIGGVVLVLAIIIIAISVAASNGGGGEGKTDLGGEPLKANVDLLTTDNVGKALEIQALLAKQGITVERQLDGTKSKLVLNKNNCSTLTKNVQLLIEIMQLLQLFKVVWLTKMLGLKFLIKVILLLQKKIKELG